MDKKEKLQNFLTYLNQQYALDVTLAFQPTSPHGTHYDPRKNLITLEETHQPLHHMLWILAHEFAHALQKSKGDMRIKESRKLFLISVIARLSFYITSILVAVLYFFYSPNFFSPLVFVLISYLTIRFIKNPLPVRYKNLRVELEKDADEFANQVVGGSEHNFDLFFSDDSPFQLHPSANERMLECQKHLLRKEFLKDLLAVSETELMVSSDLLTFFNTK